MTKIFYDHLIVIEEVIALLDQHGLNPKEKAELLTLIDETLHHHILDEILSLLPPDRHNEFLTRFHAHPDDAALLDFLRKHSAADIDKAILDRANGVKKDLIKTIFTFSSPTYSKPKQMPNRLHILRRK